MQFNTERNTSYYSNFFFIPYHVQQQFSCLRLFKWQLNLSVLSCWPNDLEVSNPGSCNLTMWQAGAISLNHRRKLFPFNWLLLTHAATFHKMDVKTILLLLLLSAEKIANADCVTNRDPMLQTHLSETRLKFTGHILHLPDRWNTKEGLRWILLDGKRNRCKPWSRMLKMIVGCCRQLEYLHERCCYYLLFVVADEERTKKQVKFSGLISFT